jgi:hypothetical protein
MSGGQDTQKSDNSDLPETGSDGGEAQNGSPPANVKGAEGTKSDKQKSKLYRIFHTAVINSINLWNTNNYGI